MRWLAVAFLLGLLLFLGAAATAATRKAKTFGPTPEQCPGLAPRDCPPGTRQGYSDTRLGDLNLSPHLVREGEKVTGTVTNSGASDWSWSPIGKALPGQPRPCEDGSSTNTVTSCTWKMTSGTGGWTTVEMAFHSGQGTGFEGEYYGAVGKDDFLIDGSIRGEDGGPVAGARVQIEPASDGPTVTATSTRDGSYSAILDQRDTYTVSAKGFSVSRCSGKTVKDGCRIELRGHGKASFSRTDPVLTGVNKNGFQSENGVLENVFVGDEISYLGERWNPDGEAIEAFWADRRVERFPAAAQFGKKLEVPPFAPGPRCEATLSVRQGQITRRLRVQGDHAAEDRARVVQGEVTLGKRGAQRELEENDAICAGELSRIISGRIPISRDSDSVLVIQGAGSSDDSDAFFISNPAKDIEVQGALFGDVEMRGRSKSTVRIPRRTIDVRSFDPAGEPGVQEVPARINSASFEGSNRHEGDMTITGGARFDGATLWVDGDLTIRGGLRGTGAILATGRILIDGPVAFNTDQATAIASERGITLNGR